MSDRPPEDGRRHLRVAYETATAITPRQTETTETAAEALPDGCPVAPLGLFGETRFYLDAHKQLVPLKAGDHTRLRLMGLFAEQSGFIRTVHRWCRTNDKGRITGWRPEVVAEDFLAACGLAGVWNPTDHERGRGAWRDETGALVLHLGDQIITVKAEKDAWTGRDIARPGLIGRLVYPAAEATPPPAERASGTAAGEELLALLESWHWRRGDLDAVLMLGWIGAAAIGGALDWRPAAWLTGGKGTGKSTLQALVKALFGAGLLDLADCTPASIWQTLERQSLAVAVDELEADEDNRRALDTMKIARLAASGGILARGSDTHTARKFTLRSCFMFSSVLIPPLAGPDRSRIAVLELQELDPTQPRLVLDEAKLRILGQQLRRAMVDGWHRFAATFLTYQTLLREVGHVARGADQFGTLLACADLLLFADETDADAAADWIARMGAGQLAEIADDTPDHEQCLAHLLAFPIDVYRKGERISLGEWLSRAAGRMPGYEDCREAARIVQSFGFRIEYDTGDPYVAVANAHSGLAALFERTRWQTPRGVTGVWTQSLRRLAGAIWPPRTLYFAGPTSKATWIPMRHFPVPDYAIPPADPAAAS